MAILFDKFPTVAAALLVGLILCSIPMNAVAVGEQLVNAANPNVIASAAAEYREFDIGKPLYRIKERQPDVPDLMVETINTISAAPGSAPTPSPTPSG